jgi:hypothetical protein
MALPPAFSALVWRSDNIYKHHRQHQDHEDDKADRVGVLREDDSADEVTERRTGNRKVARSSSLLTPIIPREWSSASSKMIARSSSSLILQT